MQCPLCFSNGTTLHHSDRSREFHLCNTCSLISVPPDFHLSFESQKGRYDNHENNPADPEYRIFLSQLMDKMLDRIPKGSRGLDFGSGPGPTLSVMFEERGFAMSNYDPIYSNNLSALEDKYDFITCSETAEHFCRPKFDWNLLFHLLNPHGYLGVMTRMYDDISFPKWHYIRDETHVAFYSKDTFNWIAERYGAQYEIFSDSVVIFNLTC